MNHSPPPRFSSSTEEPRNSIPQHKSPPYNSTEKPISPSSKSPEMTASPSNSLEKTTSPSNLSEKTTSPFNSPVHTNAPVSSPEKTTSPPLSPVFIVMPTRSVIDEPVMMTKVDTDGVIGSVGAGGVVGGGRRRRPTVAAEKRRGLSFLGFRVCGMFLCMISFSVMAADKNQGWALDSFDRYKEFRYCMAVNVIAFVYSGAQASDVAYHLTTGNHGSRPSLRYYFNFFMDQVLSYLLISSSSSAATRVEDWKSNWGKDKFTQMASASIALSFLAFVTMASTALLSGYGLCTLKSTT